MYARPTAPWCSAPLERLPVHDHGSRGAADSADQEITAELAEDALAVRLGLRCFLSQGIALWWFRASAERALCGWITVPRVTRNAGQMMRRLNSVGL